MDSPVDAADPRPAPDRKLALIIANPATKGDISEYVAAVRAAAPPDVDVWVRYTRRGKAPLAEVGDLADRADVLIAAGGDGTVTTVAQIAMRRGLPIGIMPAGSTNIVARDLGIPGDPGGAARLIFGPHARRSIDLGLCNDRWFLHMGGSGIDSRLFLSTNQSHKKRLGWKAYLLPALRNIFGPPARFTLTTEHGTVSVISPLVLVAIGGSILRPELQIAPDIARDDGYLDVFIFTPKGANKVAETGLKLLSRQSSPYITRIRCKRLEMDADPTMPVEIDGDVVTLTPATFTIEPLALQVIVPSTSARRRI
jgi:diacylglycerol kinase family enzyme